MLALNEFLYLLEKMGRAYTVASEMGRPAALEDRSTVTAIQRSPVIKPVW